MKLFRGKIWVLLTVVLAGILIMLAVRHRSAQEPVVSGRTFSSWFHEDELAPAYVNISEATKAIRAMSNAAIPFLAARVRHDDSAWDKFYWQHYPTLSPRIRKILGEPHPPGARQTMAAQLLLEMGPAVRLAAPDLIAAYDRAYCRHFQLPVRSAVDWTEELTHPPAGLFSGGPTPVPEGQFRFWAAPDLARWGADDPQVIPLLLCALHEPDANWHGLITGYAKNNTNLIPAITRSEPTLLIALNDANPVVRAAAVQMLGLMPTNHDELAPPLLKAADDLDESVRLAALEALNKFPVKLTDVLPLVGRALTNGKPELHQQAMFLLVRAGGGGKNFLSALDEALGNPNPSVRAAAAQGLALFGSHAKSSEAKLTELTDASREPDAKVREMAATALQAVRGEAH